MTQGRPMYKPCAHWLFKSHATQRKIQCGFPGNFNFSVFLCLGNLSADTAGLVGNPYLLDCNSRGWGANPTSWENCCCRNGYCKSSICFSFLGWLPKQSPASRLLPGLLLLHRQGLSLRWTLEAEWQLGLHGPLTRGTVSTYADPTKDPRWLVMSFIHSNSHVDLWVKGSFKELNLGY